MNKFSVILPIFFRPNYPHPRFKWLERAIASVLNQTYKEFELIIVDDGCIPEVSTVVPENKNIKIVRLDKNYGRLVARNRGLEVVKNEWICMLDSDDEYLSIYLECLDNAINLFPDFKVFNFGTICYHKDYGVSFRNTFEPKVLPVGHEVFGSGRIGMGSFVFHKDVINDVGGFPEKGLWDFAENAKQQFPELRDIFPGPRELGNPWGDDFYLFYKITRKYHSKPLKTYLYIQHSKEGHEFKKL